MSSDEWMECRGTPVARKSALFQFAPNFTKPTACPNQTTTNATAEVAGIVRIHAHTMRSTRFSLIALKRFAHPTPMIEVVIAWVVDTGIPIDPATASTVAAVVSAAKPWTG